MRPPVLSCFNSHNDWLRVCAAKVQSGESCPRHQWGCFMAATTSAASTPRARALSAAWRTARLARGVGQRELARMLSISHTDLSLWENCRRVPNAEQVAMILAALRVPPE